MRRRDLLAAMPPAAAGLAGCFDFGSMYSSGMLSAADLGTCPDREREGTSQPGQKTDAPVQIFVRNDSDTRHRIDVTVEGLKGTYVDETVEIAGGKRVPLFDPASKPKLTGEYRLSFVIEDGGRFSADWQVCQHTDDLVVIVTSGGGFGFERPE
jgi:hypothetical protein